MTKKKPIYRVVALLLVVALLAVSLPMSVFAETVQTPNKAPELLDITPEDAQALTEFGGELESGGENGIISELLKAAKKILSEALKAALKNVLTEAGKSILNKIFGDDEAEIKGKLDTIIANQEKMIGQLNDIMKNQTIAQIAQIKNNYELFKGSRFEVVKLAYEGLKQVTADLKANRITDKQAIEKRLSILSDELGIDYLHYQSVDNEIDRIYLNMRSFLMTRYTVAIDGRPVELNFFELVKMLKRIAVPWQSQGKDDVNVMLDQLYSEYLLVSGIEILSLQARQQLCDQLGDQHTLIDGLLKKITDDPGWLQSMSRTYQNEYIQDDDYYFWHPAADVRIAKLNDEFDYNAPFEDENDMDRYVYNQAFPNSKIMQWNSFHWDYFNKMLLRPRSDGSWTTASDCITADQVNKCLRVAKDAYHMGDISVYAWLATGGLGLHPEAGKKESNIAIFDGMKLYRYESRDKYLDYYDYRMAAYWASDSADVKVWTDATCYKYWWYCIKEKSYIKDNRWSHISYVVLPGGAGTGGFHSSDCGRFLYNGYDSETESFCFTCEDCDQEVKLEWNLIDEVYEGELMAEESGQDMTDAEIFDMMIANGDIDQDVIDMIVEEAGNESLEWLSDDYETRLITTECKDVPSPEDPVNPVDPQPQKDTKTVDSVDTGITQDSANVWIAVSVLVGLAIVMVGLVIYRKRKKD